MIEAHLNVKPWLAALDELNRSMRGDSAEMLIEEHARLTATIVNFTPPPIGQGNPQRLGEAAVERDVKRVISEADGKLLDPLVAKYGTTDIDTYITTKVGAHLHARFDWIDANGTNLADLHNRYRDTRGHVPALKEPSDVWRARVLTLPGKRDEYLKIPLARVGLWKSKWAYCASLLGAKFPQWISRHFGSLGGKGVADIKLNDLDKPSITFGCVGPNARRMMSKIADALRTRVKAMRKRAALHNSGYSKDLASKMRPRRHVSETRTPGETVE